MKTEDKTHESKLRRQLKKLDYRLVKSRVRNTHINNLGGYMVIDNTHYQNAVYSGSNYELSLDNVQEIVNDLLKTRRK